jgi:hypothetical protein
LLEDPDFPQLNVIFEKTVSDFDMIIALSRLYFRRGETIIPNSRTSGANR